MNSIKSLTILTLLAIVGLFLYWKINEKEVDPPPEAAGMAFDVPEIELSENASPGVPLPNPGGNLPGQGVGTTAPVFRADSYESSAPPWESPATAPPPAAKISSAVSLPSARVASNPFSRAVSNAGASTPSVTDNMPTGVTPDTSSVPPPGAMPSGSEEPFVTGRVYPDPPETAQSQPPDTLGSAPQPFEREVSVPPVPNPDPAPVTPLAVARRTADNLLANGNYADALRFLSDYYGEPTYLSEEQQEIADLLSQLAGTVIYSTQHQLESPYVVQPGETLGSIAATFGVPAELLAKINGPADPNNVPPGTELKVVRGPFSAVVDLTRRELVLMLDGRYAGRFNIGVGIDQPNLEGAWTVAAKETNPVYQAGNQPIAGGDPTNPLGDRMLVMQAAVGPFVAPIGIHGSPATSGLGDPRGFIRLSSADAADVFDILSVGSQVTVRR